MTSKHPAPTVDTFTAPTWGQIFDRGTTGAPDRVLAILARHPMWDHDSGEWCQCTNHADMPAHTVNGWIDRAIAHGAPDTGPHGPGPAPTVDAGQWWHCDRVLWWVDRVCAFTYAADVIWTHDPKHPGAGS